MGLARENYPDFARLGQVAEIVSKGHVIAVMADFARQLFGEDLPDEKLQGIVADRLDTLKSNGLVPSSVPDRLPRHRP